jgi:hypothetical protein
MLGMAVDELWVDYLAVGGSLTPAVLATFLQGSRPLPDGDYDLLVDALNERFVELGGDHPLLYAHDL